ncbi:Uncharacterised protein [Vibrio cholerae]|nr:Uncharacterised protein [Vibrio cholerae]
MQLVSRLLTQAQQGLSRSHIGAKNQQIGKIADRVSNIQRAIAAMECRHIESKLPLLASIGNHL